MATLLVKVASSMTLDGAQALIMGQHSYLEFVRSFPSFRTIQFTAPSEDQSSIDEIRKLAYVHGATYDKEYQIDPVVGGETAIAEFETDTFVDNTEKIEGTRNTRIITGSGGGTAISEPCLSNGGGIGMVCGHGFGFGREGVGAGCTALLGCSAFTCGRGCVAVEALWLNASLDDEECVLETMCVGFG